ncbi:DUF6602 domain-containing protein [Variovorax sp. GB1R11]|uniref:DUF6602 domain-containing protein n=1 Tax=Variovorax sp. GB1R11 TaxID=3443741 RepID=UPI003F46716D
MNMSTVPTALQAGPDDSTWMRKSFSMVQSRLRVDLGLGSQSISHAGTMGSVNEGNWIAVLRAYLPDRYEVEQAIVIDSRGNRSDQMDVVIFDRHFTPVLLDQANHRLVPAEAVYAVFECKPTFDKGLIEYAQAKAKSVRELHRTSVGIAHAGGMYAPKIPFRIAAGLLAPEASWADGLGKSFTGNLSTALDQRLDCGCALDHGAFDWFDGSLKVVPAECGLIHFLFRLLSHLQGLGTVPAIDWREYAKIVE